MDSKVLPFCRDDLDLWRVGCVSQKVIFCTHSIIKFSLHHNILCIQYNSLKTEEISCMSIVLLFLSLRLFSTNPFPWIFKLFRYRTHEDALDVMSSNASSWVLCHKQDLIGFSITMNLLWFVADVMVSTVDLPHIITQWFHIILRRALLLSPNLFFFKLLCSNVILMAIKPLNSIFCCLWRENKYV